MVGGRKTHLGFEHGAKPTIGPGRPLGDGLGLGRGDTSCEEGTAMVHGAGSWRGSTAFDVVLRSMPSHSGWRGSAAFDVEF